MTTNCVGVPIIHSYWWNGHPTDEESPKRGQRRWTDSLCRTGSSRRNGTASGLWRASTEQCSVTLYSGNGLIVSDNYNLIAKALEKVRHDCVTGRSELERLNFNCLATTGPT